MGGRWLWMGMVGLCSLASGCREHDSTDTTGLQATPTRDSTNGALWVPARPVLAQGATDGLRSQAIAQIPPDTAPPPGTRRLLRSPPKNEPDRMEEEQTPATGGSGMPPARPPAEGAVGPTTNGQPGTPDPDEGRVMIGAQAVQANDDEAWYEGAAKAAQAAVTDNTADRPLEQVVIASSTVSGKVTRVGRDSLHVRDAEGTVYELQLDPRSRGLRQGQRVSLRELREGTPVSARFDLIGGRTVARDVQVRR